MLIKRSRVSRCTCRACGHTSLFSKPRSAVSSHTLSGFDARPSTAQPGREPIAIISCVGERSRRELQGQTSEVSLLDTVIPTSFKRSLTNCGFEHSIRRAFDADPRSFLPNTAWHHSTTARIQNFEPLLDCTLDHFIICLNFEKAPRMRRKSTVHGHHCRTWKQPIWNC